MACCHLSASLHPAPACLDPSECSVSVLRHMNPQLPVAYQEHLFHQESLKYSIVDVTNNRLKKAPAAIALTSPPSSSPARRTLSLTLSVFCASLIPVQLKYSNMSLAYGKGHSAGHEMVPILALKPKGEYGKEAEIAARRSEIKFAKFPRAQR